MYTFFKKTLTFLLASTFSAIFALVVLSEHSSWRIPSLELEDITTFVTLYDAKVEYLLHKALYAELPGFITRLFHICLKISSLLFLSCLVLYLLVIRYGVLVLDVAHLLRDIILQSNWRTFLRAIRHAIGWLAYGLSYASNLFVSLPTAVKFGILFTILVVLSVRLYRSNVARGWLFLMLSNVVSCGLYGVGCYWLGSEALVRFLVPITPVLPYLWAGLAIRWRLKALGLNLVKIIWGKGILSVENVVELDESDMVRQQDEGSGVPDTSANGAGDKIDTPLTRSSTLRVQPGKPAKQELIPQTPSPAHFTNLNCLQLYLILDGFISLIRAIPLLGSIMNTKVASYPILYLKTTILVYTILIHLVNNQDIPNLPFDRLREKLLLLVDAILYICFGIEKFYTKGLSRKSELKAMLGRISTLINMVFPSQDWQLLGGIGKLIKYAKMLPQFFLLLLPSIFTRVYFGYVTLVKPLVRCLAVGSELEANERVVLGFLAAQAVQWIVKLDGLRRLPFRSLQLVLAASAVGCVSR